MVIRFVFFFIFPSSCFIWMDIIFIWEKKKNNRLLFSRLDDGNIFFSATQPQWISNSCKLIRINSRTRKKQQRKTKRNSHWRRNHGQGRVISIFFLSVHFFFCSTFLQTTSIHSGATVNPVGPTLRIEWNHVFVLSALLSRFCGSCVCVCA